MKNKQPSTQEKPISLKNWFSLLLLSIVWGSSFILIKKGLIAFNATQLASLRISISALAFLPLFLIQLKGIDWSKFKYFILVGLLGSGIPAYLYAFAQTEISSSVAGLLNSLTPIFTLLAGILFFRLQWKWSNLIGVFLGFIGALFLIFIGENTGLSGDFRYSFLVVLGTICYALSLNTVKTYLQNIPSLTISSVSFFIIGIPASIYLFTTDFLSVLQEHEHGWSSLGYIATLSIIGTVLASIIFFKIVQETNPLFASMVSYLIPIVAVLWGILDGESFFILHTVGMAFILIGVYISKK
ncbi:MAG: DMT family transporter [Saprospiraceae bacterium]